MEEGVVNQQKKQHKAPWLRDYEWKPGVSGNPKGRPKGKTLKEWAKEFLLQLPDEKKLEFLKEVEAYEVWRMAEGNPHQETDVTSGGKPIYIPSELIPKNDLPQSTESDSE